MDASQLLTEYARRHDAALEGASTESLAELFRADGEVVFHGVPVPRTRGREAIERLHRERGPEDALVLGRTVPGPAGVVQATYGWRSSPGRIGGTLRLRAKEGLVERLDVMVLRDGPKPPRPREAARALIVSPDERMLLLPCTEPLTRALWWITPGGGVEDGETPVQAVRRELVEEIGYDAGSSPGPLVWVREHVFTWGDNALRQREHYFLVRTADPLAGAARWWTLDELRTTPADVFAPEGFPDLLAALLRDGPPAEPRDVGA